MTVIQYRLPAGQTGGVSDRYAGEFQAELEKLQQLKKYQQMKKLQKAKRLSTKINDNRFYFDEYKLSDMVQSAIRDMNFSSGETYSSAVAKLYQAFSEKDDSSFKDSAQAMIGLRDELVQKTGMKYSVLNTDATDLELMADQGLTALSNVSKNVKMQVGNIGEGISSFMGVVVADTLISELSKKIEKMNKKSSSNAISLSNISVEYENVGGQYRNGMRLQTDNILTIKADIGKEKSVVLFQLNLSDKASAKFKTQEGQVNKRRAYFRGSTVQALSKSLNWNSVANTISYHWDEDLNKRVTFGSSLKALQRYYGSKLLLDMFSNKNSDTDAIDFTVNAGRLIPETDVFNMLYKNNETTAFINRYKLTALIGKGLNKEDDAEDIIRSLPVSLIGSI